MLPPLAAGSLIDSAVEEDNGGTYFTGRWENQEGPAHSDHSQPLTIATGPRVHTLPGWETKQAAGSEVKPEGLQLGCTLESPAPHPGRLSFNSAGE